MIGQYVHQFSARYPAARNHHDDICQQIAFELCVMSTAQAYNPERSKNFAGWLYHVTRNQAYEFMRGQKQSLTTLCLADLGDPPADATDHDPLHFEYIGKQIEAACGADDARIFLLRREKGMKVKEIAEMVGRSEAAIYKQLGRLEQKMFDLGLDYFLPPAREY
jgi:RNA polymerase sigma factor (sigma-70 family)